jgi:integrase
MQLQVALCQPGLKFGPEGLCFALAAAVDQSIIGIPTPGKVGVCPRYPEIERVMGAGWTIRLQEKGGKQHAMPCHHALAEALHAYIDAAGIAEDRKGFLFRTARGHKGTVLSDKAMSQRDAWRMIRRRAAATGIAAEIGCHTFRATGITAYLANGGALEHAQEMAAHESPRTTKLYDRTKDRLTQDEVEKIRL